MPAPYTPIDCNYYDILLTNATQRQAIELVFINETGEEVSQTAIITNVFTRQGEEFLLTDNQTTIRLDRLISVGGVERSGFLGCRVDF